MTVTTATPALVRGGTFGEAAPHGPDRLRVSADDEGLVANVGLSVVVVEGLVGIASGSGGASAGWAAKLQVCSRLAAAATRSEPHRVPLRDGPLVQHLGGHPRQMMTDVSAGGGRCVRLCRFRFACQVGCLGGSAPGRPTRHE